MRSGGADASTRTRELRQRVAIEAARLMAEGGLRDFQAAKLRAASRLGVVDESALPRNAEIEQALREHQRLFQSAKQPDALQARRLAALEALQFLRRFDARLVGAVLDGSADAHSAVCLHLFEDRAENVEHFLAESGIPIEQRSRRLRLDHARSEVFPVYQFSADGVPFELIVLPRSTLRQPPLDPVDGKPMQRASLSALRSLLDAPAG
jgi:hypothetical protein